MSICAARDSFFMGGSCAWLFIAFFHDVDDEGFFFTWIVIYTLYGMCHLSSFADL
jgi:hypothetical protein